jgi:branched-chain amino acid transport system ATP-binding protein
MLVIKNLEAFYGRIQALKGISLHVAAGEIVCLIGANGAGKTTTLHTISGLITQTSGDILFEGAPINRLAPEKIVKRGIAQSPEGRQIFAPLSVPDNLRLGAYIRHDRDGIKHDLEWIFDLFPRLAERRTHLAGNLSGGEQQMLAFGRALMSRPKLLLLDEPSTGLAPLIIREIFDVIVKLRDEGLTVLLVEQNAHIALTISDRGYVLETGRVVFSGTSEELARSADVRRAYLGSPVEGFLEDMQRK